MTGPPAFGGPVRALSGANLSAGQGVIRFAPLGLGHVFRGGFFAEAQRLGGS